MGDYRHSHYCVRAPVRAGGWAAADDGVRVRRLLLCLGDGGVAADVRGRCTGHVSRRVALRNRNRGRAALLGDGGRA